MRLLPFLLAVLLSLAGTMSMANNIQVANASLIGNTDTSAQIQFDLSWENSWRGGGVTNWDAAWVFVKYRTSLTGQWSHVLLNNTSHVPAAGSQIDIGLRNPGSAYHASTNPVVGVFIYRGATGTGTLDLPATELHWNFAAYGLNFNDIAEVQVLAIEMVYVPQGAFAAGSGGAESSAFTLTTISTAAANTFPIPTGSLGGQAGGYPTGQTAPNVNWPNGFNAFYCMKYEVSQQGYVDFLNSLTYAQQATRTSSAPNSFPGTNALSPASRNGIVIETPGLASTSPASYACNVNGNGVFGEATDGGDIACNHLSWGDLAAYLFWSGLRPMTELEFEKACRGTIVPVANEYPWGITGTAGSAYTLANAGASNEGIATNYSTTLGNASYATTDGPINGPLRVGIFAANGSNSGRVTAGASYYGIMELGGNLWERTVTYGLEGGAFNGQHGNGTLNIGGHHNGYPSWPPITGAGVGSRGGAFSLGASYMRVSDRGAADYVSSDRWYDMGGRGVRNAP